MKQNKATRSVGTFGAGTGRSVGKFTTKVATAEQRRKADILLKRIKEEVSETGWLPYPKVS